MHRKVTSILLLVLVLFTITVSMILAASPDVTSLENVELVTDTAPAHDTVPEQAVIFKSHGPEGCSAFAGY
jgi:hypothetical protein